MDRSRLVFCFILGLLSFAIPRLAQAQEFRALWADTFHAGLRNSTEVSQLVDNARVGNFNAVIVEVRKRGDAYYNSNYEPKATDVSPQSFDPLADLIAKAHNTNNGPRIEVHTWIVTYNIWNNQTTPPTQATHPYRLHPDWLTEDVNGETWEVSGGNYAFDPSHPAVQQHTFNVAMDLISRYDLDGFNFDYIRYAGKNWGYHPIAVQRFNARYGRSGQPSSTDPAWLQFRRDQVTSLVRKIYLSSIALKPRVKISADTICFAPGITSDSQWFNSSAAYTDKLQDWRGWMQEGILDLNIPMAYFRHNDVGATYNRATDWTNWSNFAKNRRFNRHVAMGAGVYLNSASNGIHQMRTTRVPASSGSPADGVALYSYGVPSSNTTRAQFLSAVTSAPNAHDANSTAIFASPVPTPVMPWKASPTLGHLKGIITNGVSGALIDGAIVTLTGPANRVQTSDATGFYGFVDLPPGTYTVTASYSNLSPYTTQTSIINGVVATLNLGPGLPVDTALSNIVAWPGRTAAIISWNSVASSDSQVEYGTTTNLGTATFVDPALVTSHAVLLSGLAANTKYFFRVRSRAGTNMFVSTLSSFATAGEMVIDNPSATFTGTWTLGISSGDKYDLDYHFVTAVAGGATATATFRPDIATPGNYDLYIWYPQGSNRSTNTPVLISHDGGSITIPVNQTSSGGGWRLLAGNRHFARGTGGFVRISNNTSDSGKVVMADAIRWVYSANQDPPLAGTVPEWWSQFYFGANVNGSLDPDNDGLKTSEEYIVGSVPTDAASGLVFEIENFAASEMRLMFSPWRGGRSYRLEEQIQLGGSNWTATANTSLSITPDGRGLFTMTNFPSTQKFFRIRILLTPE